MNSNLKISWLLACTVSFAPGVANAVDYCVGSIAQFANAMNDAEIDGADSVIQFRSGTYTMANNVVYQPTSEFVLPAGKLTVRGGYNADCSNYSLTPGATTINGGGNRLVARTHTGDVTFVGLRLNSTFLVLDGNVTEGCPRLPTFALRRLRIDQGSADIYARCQSVVVENALFTNGVVVPGQPNFGGDTSLGVNLISFDDYTPWANLTMTNSTISNGRLHLRSCCSDGVPTARLYNSIFDRPAGNDIFSSSVNVLAHYNRYDGISFSNGGLLVPGSGNNVSSAPQLDSQYVPSIGSPMFNTGTESVPGGLPANDLSGGDRVVGFGVDRGAMESPVDGSGIYVVSNTNASGNGSLAQAVELANTEAGFNTIRFNIPSGPCPRFISLAGPLQIRESVSIDGWSQPGSVINTDDFSWNAVPCVAISGGGTVGIGIESMGQIGTGRISVRGLAFQGFGLAIALAFGEDHAIYGNQFGGRVGNNLTLTGNEQAIGLIGGGRTTIGGNSASSRNLIGDSSDVGVLITTFLGAGGDDNNVINNLIGVDKTGAGALPNGTGIRINGGFNLVRGNLIGRNTVDGILISGPSAEGNVIEDNNIGGGLGLFGGNGRAGVLLQGDAHDNIIGPNNSISRNGDSGVRLLSTSGGRNTITANVMALNDSPGIDLGANGVTPNDFDPQLCFPDFGCAANREQNFPSLSEAVRVRTGFFPTDRPMRIGGRLTSVIGGPYRIELFASNSCYSAGHGQGSRYLGYINLTIANAGICSVGTNNCSASFSTHVSELDLAIGDVVTATATSPGGDTSEFSACMEVIDEPDDDLIFADDFEN